MINMERLLDYKMNWVRFNISKPFKIFCHDQNPCKIPADINNQRIQGFFILAGHNSYLYLFDPKKEIYCFLESFEVKKAEVDWSYYYKVLFLNPDPKIMVCLNSKIALTNNYFCYQGKWFQEIIKI